MIFISLLLFTDGYGFFFGFCRQLTAADQTKAALLAQEFGGSRARIYSNTVQPTGSERDRNETPVIHEHREANRGASSTVSIDNQFLAFGDGGMSISGRTTSQTDAHRRAGIWKIFEKNRF
jgi:hypothetical protein